MSGFLMMVGITALAILLVIIIKIIDNYYEDRKVGTEISEKIYQAAEKFSAGASDDEIRTILLNCIDFDEDEVDEILELSTSFRADHDGGYIAFINTTRKVLKNY